MGRTALPATSRGGRVRFTLPGGVVFDGRRNGRALAGTVRQGSLRGSFRLTPGSSRVLPALGLYRAADGAAVAIVQATGLPTWLVELPSGDIHGLNAKLTTVGARLGSTSGDGTLAVTPSRVTWTQAGAAKQYTRVRVAPARGAGRRRCGDADAARRARAVPGRRDDARLGPSDA